MSNVLSHKDLMKHLERLRTQGSERTRWRREKLAKDASMGRLPGVPERMIADNGAFTAHAYIKVANVVELDHTPLDIYIIDPATNVPRRATWHDVNWPRPRRKPGGEQ